jgi:hypothetical protein
MSYEIQDQRIITLNSADANKNNGSFLSSVMFPFSQILSDEIDILYTTIGVLSAQIPISYYVINESNDLLIFKHGSDVSKNLFISHGNYNAYSFATALQTAFSELGYTFTISTSKITGKISFTSTTDFIFYESPMYNILGFIVGSTNTSTSFVLTGTYPLNLLGIKNIKIVSNALIVNNFDSKSYGSNTCICNIPVNVPSYSMLDFVNMTSMFPVLNVKTLSIIDIRIYDENNNLINFNGVDWSIVLQMNIHRRKMTTSLTFDSLVNAPIYSEPPLTEEPPQPSQIEDPSQQSQEEAQNYDFEQQPDLSQMVDNNPVGPIDEDENDLNFLMS